MYYLCTQIKHKSNQINTMCLIIVKEKGKYVSHEVIRRAAEVNKDGLGIVWLDDFTITYHKSKAYKLLVTDRPYVAHFRYATVGKVGKDNTHPFKCGDTNEYLMMNGTIRGLGNKDICDTKVLANMIGYMPRDMWSDQLSMFSSRFVSVDVEQKKYEIFNRDLWTEYEGVLYSKDEVLENNYVAVYGTLKKGNSNYHHYLSDSTFVGSGVTSDKYPMVVPQTLPYLLHKKGKGHHVEVDVFKVSNSVMKSLDALEGHPNFYTRKKINIDTNGTKVSCWIYFNMKMELTPDMTPIVSYKSFQNDWKPKPQLSGGASTWDGKYTKNDNIFDQHDQKESVCPHCYSDLKHDDFNSYHCSRCGSWHESKDVLFL